MPKLDRLARSVPDARAIADQLRERGVKLALGRTLCDPGDPMGKLFFSILATFAEFEADLIRMRTREGMAIAPGQSHLDCHGLASAAAICRHSRGNGNPVPQMTSFLVNIPIQQALDSCFRRSDG